MNFNARLEQAILKKYKNIRQFGEAAGINDALIRTYTKGKSVPSIKKVEEFAEMLDVSPSWLAYGVDVSSDYEDKIIDLTNLIHKKIDLWLDSKDKEMDLEKKSVLVKLIYKKLQLKELHKLSNKEVSQSIDDFIEILAIAA